MDLSRICLIKERVQSPFSTRFPDEIILNSKAFVIGSKMIMSKDVLGASVRSTSSISTRKSSKQKSRIDKFSRKNILNFHEAPMPVKDLCFGEEERADCIFD